MAATINDQAMFLISPAEKVDSKGQKEKFAVGPTDPQGDCVAVDVDLLCELDLAPVENCYSIRFRSLLFDCSLRGVLLLMVGGVFVGVLCACVWELITKAQMGPQEKGSFGSEKKTVAATMGGGGSRGEGFNKEAAAPCGGAGLAPDKAVIVVHSAGVAFPGTPPARTPPFRRRRAPPRWSDPRKVLFFFAALSSMGTIILLYFTLAMGRVDGKEGSSSW